MTFHHLVRSVISNDVCLYHAKTCFLFIEIKFSLFELLQLAAKVHTFNNNICRAVAFAQVLKNPFEVLQSSKPYALVTELPRNVNNRGNDRAIE